MKRIRIVSVCALIVVVAAGAIVLARPQWLPAWARIDPEVLPAWARFGGQDPAAEEAADAGLYCKEHGVPEKFCTTCYPEVAKK